MIAQLELCQTIHSCRPSSGKRSPAAGTARNKPAGPLESLPRVTQTHAPVRNLSRLRRHAPLETTSETGYVPAHFEIRIMRPAERGVRRRAGPHPADRSIEPGGSGITGHVLVSKYADHLPLYRQRKSMSGGSELDRSTLAGWVGGPVRRWRRWWNNPPLRNQRPNSEDDAGSGAGAGKRQNETGAYGRTCGMTGQRAVRRRRRMVRLLARSEGRDAEASAASVACCADGYAGFHRI